MTKQVNELKEVYNILDEDFDENDKIIENIRVHFQLTCYNHFQQFETP